MGRHDEAYQNEIKRLTREIMEIEAEGYQFPDYAILRKPRQITQAEVLRLRKISKADLLERAFFIDPNGEIIYGISGKKPTDTIPTFDTLTIQNFKEKLAPSPVLTEWFSRLEGQYTKAELAHTIEEAENQGVVPTFEILYVGNLTYEFIEQFMKFFGIDPKTVSKLIDEIEEVVEWFEK